MDIPPHTDAKGPKEKAIMAALNVAAERFTSLPASFWGEWITYPEVL